MKAHQYDKLAMYKAVRVLLTTTEDTRGIVAFPSAFQRFLALLDALTALTLTQLQRLAPALADRDVILGAAVREALRISGIVVSHAHAQGLDGLKEKVRVTPRAFRQARFADRVVLAQRVHDATVPVVAQLEPSGITAATLAAFQAKIDAAAAAITLPRMTVVMKASAREQLVFAFREVDAALRNQLDPLLLPLKDTKPEFHARYSFVRKIVHHSRRRSASPPDSGAEAEAPAITPVANPATLAA